MVELETEEHTGPRTFRGDRLPLSVGRRGASFIIDQYGVLDRHVILSRDSEGWIVATPQGEASVFRGGDQLGPSTRLRNGDQLYLGSARLRFRISNCRQRPLRALETLAFSGLLLLVVAQISLLFRF